MSSKPPKPTKQETALTQAQTDLLAQQKTVLQQQLDQQNLLTPLVYKQLNIAPKYDEAGKVVGFDQLGPTQEEQASKLQFDTYKDQLGLQKLLQPYEFKQLGLTPQYGADGQLTGFQDDPNSAQNQQLAYQKQQLEAQQQGLGAQSEQLRLDQILQPYQLKQLGLQGTYGDDGKLTGVTELPKDANQAKQEQYQQELLDRSLRALHGELPVDQGLLDQYRDDEASLRAGLQRQLGSGYEASTPGIEALAKFTRNKEVGLDAARRGDITTAGQLALATNQANLGNRGFSAAQLFGVGSSTAGAAGALRQGNQPNSLADLYGAGSGVTGAATNFSPYSAQGGTAASLSTLLGGVGAPFQGSQTLGSLASLFGNAAQGQFGLRTAQKNRAAGALGGALSGAVAGSAVNFPYGTAVGAIGGAGVGAFA